MSTKYNPTNIESKWYQHWLKNKIFESKPDAREPYTIVIPPPNVTGVLHMGHMLNNTIQDILIRRARLLGFNACWVPGTDHASIATEAKVLKKLKNEGVDKQDLCREDFLKHAWEWKEKHGGIILDQLKKLGASCDWSRVKFTMDDDMSDSVIDAFINLYHKGYIYRGERMINWDPKAKTAISDEEVIYHEQDSLLYYVDYKLTDSNNVFTVATTRPETILGDTAICVHPDDQRYKDFIGKKVLVPLINREIPIITDHYIDPEFGTGALKVTPAHDVNDYEIGKKNQLEIISVIDENGLIHEDGQLYVGEDRFQVRKKIIKDIDAIGQLNKTESIKNKVGFSERTNVIIEPRLSTQWFMKMDQLAKPALDNVLNDNIKFYPSKIKNTYQHWMNNIRDWCLSRQLWWGHRIPAFYYNQFDYVIAKDKKDALKIAKIQSGDNSLKLSDLRQDEDVLDTWFSSWVWPISVFDGIQNPKNSDFQYYYPTNDLVTGPDILFFWVARMIIAGYHFENKEPFKHVYFTGIVRDEKRRKMSKSLGNSPDPLELIDKYGADGVRSAMLFASPAGNDLLFDENLCQQGRNFCNKIWNAFRLVDSWAVSELEANKIEKETIIWFDNKLKKEIIKLDQFFAEFRISDCLMTLYKLIWDDFCSCYLELIKPTDKVISGFVKKNTIVFFEKILICLHPFMPFLTEELWHKLTLRKSNDSISLSAWPTQDSLNLDEDLLSNFTHLFDLVGTLRKIRKEKNIPFKQSLKLITDKEDIIHFKDILHKMCNVDNIEYYNHQENKEEQLLPFLIGSHKYSIPLLSDFDSVQEIEKINNQIDYFTGFLNSIDRKLSNKKFMDNAPKKVVDIELKKKHDTLSKITSLKSQLKSLHEH